MLYNKDWNKAKAVPTTDPISLDGLIAWLATKDPGQGYHFTDTSQCLLAQWVKHLDPKARALQLFDNCYTYQVNGKVVDFQYTVFDRIIASNQTNTFGEALARAKAYQRKGKR